VEIDVNGVCESIKRGCMRRKKGNRTGTEKKKDMYLIGVDI